MSYTANVLFFARHSVMTVFGSIEVKILIYRSDNGDVTEYGEENRDESEEEEGFELGDDIDEDDEDGDEEEDLIIDESGGDTAAVDDASNGANADLASVKSLISSASKPLNFFSGESHEEKSGTIIISVDGS